jgi:gliding motility-associated-like protein
MWDHRPQFEVTKMVTDDTSWTKIEGTIKATSSWRYVTIGNPHPDHETNYVGHEGQCLGAYYFVDDVSVKVIPMEIQGDSIICRGETITLRGRNTENFKWATETNPEMIVSTDSLLMVSPAINTTYLLCGLNDTTYFHVTVLPSPTLSYSDTCELNWATIQLSANDGVEPYSYNWSNGNVGDFNDRVNDGNYQIIVSDANQCRDTVIITTTCIEQGSVILVPQAFTPNQDGKNDFLPVFGDVAIISGFDWSIFNRWGNLVFYTNDIGIISSGDLNKGWDGTYKGAEQKTGVYVYSINVQFVNSKKSTFSGNITLIR